VAGLPPASHGCPAMKYLFVHQNFPGQFLHILRHLAAQKQHELLFITENDRNNLVGVRKMLHTLGRQPAAGAHPHVHDLELALIRAEAVARSSAKLKHLGFVPDIIIGHHGWGEMLHLNDVFPDSPLLGYQEYFYNLKGYDVGFDPEFPANNDISARLRVKNMVNLMSLTNPGFGQTPTQFQLETYPEWARPNISVLEEGVNLDVCKPNPELRARVVTIGGYKVKPNEKLVSYVVRDLEPYRGFHMMMRALPKILGERADTRVILVGGDGASYGAKPANGTWREHMLNELSSRMDVSRVHFAGRVQYEAYLKLLQRSDTHVYLTYPFVASWSLREAMSTGCAIVGSDTAPVREFIRHRKTGLLAPFLQPDTIADRVLELLEDDALNQRLRTGARAWAVKHLDMDTYLRAYEALIARAMAA
jgi:glycosyltransferase involved in cell wall biosynthesis